LTAREISEGWARKTDTTGLRGSGGTLATGAGFPVKTNPETSSPEPVSSAAIRNFLTVKRCRPKLCVGVVVTVITIAKNVYRESKR
jgi:hypothetical protein